MANLANIQWRKPPEKWLKPCNMGTHLRVLIKSCPMNSNMTGFRWFSEIFAFLCFGLKEPQLGYFRPMAQGCKDLWKSSKLSHVGIHWIALTGYYQMSTNVPLFQSFSDSFCYFVLATLSTSSIRVNTLIMFKAAQKQGSFLFHQYHK